MSEFMRRATLSGGSSSSLSGTTSYAHFTLADPMARLCSDAVGGESFGEYASDACPARPVSSRDTIHIGRRVRVLSADLDQ